MRSDKTSTTIPELCSYADVGCCEERKAGDQSDGARVGNQATRMVRATQRADVPVFVRY